MVAERLDIIQVEHLKLIFQELYQRDPILPALLAARCALRVFPFVAYPGDLDIWWEDGVGDEPGQDNRRDYVLAIFFTCHEIIHQSRFEPENRLLSNIAITSEKFVAVAAISSAVACSAYYAACAAVFSSTEGVVADAVYSIAHAVGSVVDKVGKNTRTEVLQQDLDWLENNTESATLARHPLWWPESPIPEEIETVYREKFIPVIHSLKAEVGDTSPETARALASMLVQYQQLLDGKEAAAPKEIHLPDPRLAAEVARSAQDFLHRESLVQGLADLLTEQENPEHVTVGLLGNWGSGKTRVIDLLKAKLQSSAQPHQFLFGEFNAWAYEHAKNPQAAMAHEVMKALTRCQRLKPCDEKSHGLRRFGHAAKNMALSLGWRGLIRSRLTLGFACRKYPGRLLSLLAFIGLPVGFNCYLFFTQHVSLLKWIQTDWLTQGGSAAYLAFLSWRVWQDMRKLLAQPYTKELLTYLKLPDYAKEIGEIAEMRDNIGIMASIRLGFPTLNCRDWVARVRPKRRLLFVVDDLDRCDPQGIVKTFEAVRLVLDLPQVYVLIAVDQRIAMAALAQHYEKLQTHHVSGSAKAIARNYLAKMIHLPVQLDDANDVVLQGYLNHLWHEAQQDQSPDWNLWLKQVAEEEPSDPPPSQNKDNVSEDPGLNKNDEQPDEPGLTEQELSQLVIALGKVQEDSEMLTEQKTGLSDRQKAAFYHWACRFDLHNARQMKRLYNSYNLINRVAGAHRDQVVESEVGEEQYRHLNFGYLVTLFCLEFINSIEDQRLRCAYNQLLRQGKIPDNIKGPETSTNLLKEARQVIEAASQLMMTGIEAEKCFGAMLNFVGRFVLPAIDGFEVDESLSV